MGFDDSASGGLDGSGKYCLECEWSVRGDRPDPESPSDPTPVDPSEAALEHFLETGHTIESVDRVPPDSFESL